MKFHVNFERSKNIVKTVEKATRERESKTKGRIQNRGRVMAKEWVVFVYSRGLQDVFVC